MGNGVVAGCDQYQGRKCHGDIPDAAGEMLLTVACHPVPLTLLRDLVPSQRRVLARDWAVAEADLAAKMRRLRRVMNGNRKSRPLSKAFRRIGTTLSQNPELILLTILVIAIAIGFARS